MSRCLVTGGAGFIGSHIVEHLIKKGYFVRVLDNFSSGKKENLEFTQGLGKDKFELVRGDIREAQVCDQACRGMDYVFMQAALRSVPQSMKNPSAYNDVNIEGTLRMLEAAAKHKIKRFVFASSSSVYGDTKIFPEKEDHLPLLISPYALTKLAGEYYCRIFSEHFELPTVCLRYFNVFGPRQALDDEYAVVVPKFIHCLMHDEQPPIFGTGKQSRDFTYIDNVVSANLLAATTAGLKHEVFNVANGEDQTVLELAKVLNKILHKNIKPKLLNPRPGDVFKTLADITKIKKRLQYRPLVNFEEGLKKTTDYFKASRP
ncbi:MAG: SDR family oxidoreductase [Candidatus Omnitrophota bacterium]|jgi:nucleoside-diphosphate-sugar epimerase|nr:SDR family oxidoreductase [Candidatus Omnitrophota bacterium]